MPSASVATTAHAKPRFLIKVLRAYRTSCIREFMSRLRQRATRLNTRRYEERFELFRRNNRQFNEAGIVRPVVDSLRCFLIVLLLCKENVAHELLRIAIVQRKPRGLHLLHDAVSWKKNMVRIR